MTPVRHPLLALLAGAALLIAIRTDASAGHPLGTEDAGTQGAGNVQVELNSGHARGAGKSRETSVVNAYTLGIASRADVAVSFAYIFLSPDAAADSVRGMGDTEVTLKTAFHDGRGAVPTVGVKAGILLPTGDAEKGLGNGRAAALLVAIADWESGPVLVHANVGATVPGRPVGSPDRADRVRASLAGEFEIREGRALVGEYLWEKNIGGSGPASSELLIGGKLEILKNVEINGGIRWGTTSASPDVTYLAGITLSFRGEKGSGGRDSR